MIRFSCPGCAATYTVGDEKGGKTGSCPKCQSRFQIPMPEGAAAPPPAPPPPAESGTVELACPGCSGQLAVNASDLGADVQCPYCNKVFTAKKGSEAPAAGSSKPKQSLDDVLGGVGGGGSSKKRRAVDDEDEEERPSRRRSRDEDEEDEEERPSRRGRSRSRADEDEEDEEEARPRKKKKKRRRDYEEHRGTLILVLGILAWVGCGIFTAIPAWLMGKSDIEKMDQGIMDPEGRSLTNVGRILGMVSTILTCIVFAGYCVLFAVIGLGGAAGR